MSNRQRLAWITVFASGGLAVLGFLVFVLGLLIEFFDSAPIENQPLSPTIQIALAGLCLSGLMVTLGFILVGFLLALQSRRQAPDYGDAYRFVESLQFQRAIPLLERAVEHGRESSDVLSLLSSAYAYNGQLAKAQAAADRAVQLYPNDPSVYVTLANGYRLQASYEEAVRALRTAVAMSPEQPIIWAELGFVQQLAGDVTAIESFQQAAKTPMPAMYSVRVYYQLAKAYKIAGDTEQAILATSKMLSARHGIEAWKPLQTAMAGTAYGQTLRYEIEDIEKAIAEANTSFGDA
jgi:tetratricopeptide (TPR) repeat protein